MARWKAPLLFRLRILASVALMLSLAGNISSVVERRQRTIVVSVPDGDSLQLKDGRRIRLLGIDAPERGRCMADEARAKLVSLALGRHVRLKNIVTDDYGRQLANVFIGGALLQRDLLIAGVARNRSGSGNPYHQVLTDAQEAAKAAKLGIWSAACRGAASEKEECTIKGNSRAGKKQYYLPDCPVYEQVIVDTAFGDGWFCTQKDAQAAGFTAAASCQ